MRQNRVDLALNLAAQNNRPDMPWSVYQQTRTTVYAQLGKTGTSQEPRLMIFRVRFCRLRLNLHELFVLQGSTGLGVYTV